MDPRLLLLCLWVGGGEAFSSGAPESVCEGDMRPRHGFAPQVDEAPVELVMDQYRMTSDQYLRVTLRSKRAFKGFLLRAESAGSNHTGSWYIPYLEDTSYLSESHYLHCSGGAQSAVTHSGRTATMFVISFQWKPPANFQGLIVFRATVVVNYRLFWVDVTAAKVQVGLLDKTPRKFFRQQQNSGGDAGGSPTAFYDEWNSSTGNTRMSEGVTESELVVEPRQVAEEESDELEKQVEDMEAMPSHQQPTSVLPAVSSHSRRGGLLMYPEYDDEEHDISTVTGWRREMNKGDDAKETTHASKSQSTETTETVKTTKSQVLTTTITTTDTSTTSTTTTSTTTTSTTTARVVSTVIPIQLTHRVDHRFIEPTFIFTTERSGRQTKELEATTTMEDERPGSSQPPSPWGGHSKPSHFFQLEDYPDTPPSLGEGSRGEGTTDNVGTEVIRRDKSDGEERSDAAMRATWLYEVNNSSEGSSEEESKVATEGVMEEEETTAAVTANNTQMESSELERSPRDNPDDIEALEGPYKRLQAQYGSWQNTASSKHAHLLLAAVLLFSIFNL